MGKIPVKVKAVTYALSPFQQKVMPGLWKDFTHKMTHKVTDNWISAILLVGPVVGVYTFSQAWYLEACQELLPDRHEPGVSSEQPLHLSWYVKSYQEREKLEHRY